MYSEGRYLKATLMIRSST